MDTNKMINNVIKILTAALIGFAALAIILKIVIGIVSSNNATQSQYEAVQLYEMSAEIQAKLSIYDNYENISFSENRARVKLNNKWGFVDENGNVAVSLIYDLVYDFSNGVAIVELNNKCGFVDKNGNEITSIAYDKIYPYVDGIAKIKKGNLYGFVDASGKEIIAAKYNSVDDFSEGLAAVGVNGTYGYIDVQGQVILPLMYQYADTFSEGYAYVKKDGQNCYINKKGEVVLTLDYDYLYTFDGGVAKVQKNGKFGFINTKGNQVTPVTFDSASPFVSGISKVEKDDKFGYINREGNVVIPMEYDEAFSVDNGYVRMIKYSTDEKGNQVKKYYLFDTTGTIKMSELNYIGEFSCGLACVGLYNSKTKKVVYGYADTSLNKVIDTVFENATTFSSDGTATVTYKNKKYLIDTKGNSIQELK